MKLINISNAVDLFHVSAVMLLAINEWRWRLLRQGMPSNGIRAVNCSRDAMHSKQGKNRTIDRRLNAGAMFVRSIIRLRDEKKGELAEPEFMRSLQKRSKYLVNY